MDIVPVGKRAFADSQSPGDEGYADEENTRENSKSNTDDLRGLSLIPKEEAWEFGISELLDSPTTITPPREGQVDGNNFKNYGGEKSLFLLCVLGSHTMQLGLLCQILPKLLALSTQLQALILTNNPSTAISALSSSPYTFPIVEAQGNPANHFLKLGLLNPLGNGKQPLDAIVLLDASGKRRLVLPFGWGEGRHVGGLLTGQVVLDTFAVVLEESVRVLEGEKRRGKKDFYDVARTYF
ncbi:hypothetical protein EJ08DRAFT_730227 [Tothia fuscella]|uniref:Uncharacterized protein n=1 Tax=Tothia fuscella TaxID=1048955 RepID=A0A9P4U3K3_9PEZI|nr:hypothetical protein EJ08DRAFT_730227 [Tothia fuscella]